MAFKNSVSFLSISKPFVDVGTLIVTKINSHKLMYRYVRQLRERVFALIKMIRYSSNAKFILARLSNSKSSCNFYYHQFSSSTFTSRYISTYSLTYKTKDNKRKAPQISINIFVTVVFSVGIATKNNMVP